MSLIARYRGRCGRCGWAIRTGQEISGGIDGPYEHVDCRNPNKSRLENLEAMDKGYESAAAMWAEQSGGPVKQRATKVTGECMFLCGRKATVKIGKIAMCGRCANAPMPSKKQINKWMAASARPVEEI
jgi:hypothetical protein